MVRWPIWSRISEEAIVPAADIVDDSEQSEEHQEAIEAVISALTSLRSGGDDGLRRMLLDPATYPPPPSPEPPAPPPSPPSPPQPPSLPPGIAITLEQYSATFVNATITADLDVTDEQSVQNFTANFKELVARVLGISPMDVIVRAVSKGGQRIARRLQEEWPLRRWSAAELAKVLPAPGGGAGMASLLLLKIQPADGHTIATLRAAEFDLLHPRAASVASGTSRRRLGDETGGSGGGGVDNETVAVDFTIIRYVEVGATALALTATLAAAVTPVAVTPVSLTVAPTSVTVTSVSVDAIASTAVAVAAIASTVVTASVTVASFTATSPTASDPVSTFPSTVAVVYPANIASVGTAPITPAGIVAAAISAAIAASTVVRITVAFYAPAPVIRTPFSPSSAVVRITVAPATTAAGFPTAVASATVAVTPVTAAASAAPKSRSVSVYFQEPVQLDSITISQIQNPGVLSVQLLPWPAAPIPALPDLAPLSGYLGASVWNVTRDNSTCGGHLVIALPAARAGTGLRVPPRGSQGSVPPTLRFTTVGGIYVTVKEQTRGSALTAIDSIKFTGRVLYPRDPAAYAQFAAPPDR
ncbi:hypothetical protein GPECTOR_59g688 [Gonium pectorale]|uniref:Uncharacterized protein n=1 Tax=Gonium pectorale TaxID=33097 RepID=A0A150G5C1_GONPE|nr:hypothetical protein GPECTOR_59g688 [Gonium pectorale]|eukprot:KXZ45079.1 hypothetical protein GPECTOR_59g688 [Gonium pectorale]